MWWGIWDDYPKVRIGAREYARIGERLYTRHAVEYFRPSGRRTVGNVPVAAGEGGGSLSSGRGIPPVYVEQAIVQGLRRTQLTAGVHRTIHTYSDIEVVTEENGKIVVTISYRH
jgi:filamentous hemagglutinin